ncbi:HEAT repeat domain-containing protein [Microseira wollei]|uniref:HEAT domain protein repeat-containing protein n=1 Tax=Microseira wollei NIES-4236 TaxID=2530354 RepID=A0AAV3X8Q1_9CYAN|nr:HEAT repeat domain-containing protein [Microseira wollei]GET37651.1 HEAT domain protein repeat-containing protein [Microseira wollei NIES-4236]
MDESRGLLSKLAFAMMQAQKPTDFRLDISEVEAQNILGSEKTLKHLLRYHLLQAIGKPGNRQIRFCHQSLQEYYAAESLLCELRQHPEWLEKMPDQKYTWFQQKYLNLLKWTEPLAVMLSLMEHEGQAVRLVNLALDVDLNLSARLAGEVKPAFQQKTVSMIARQKVPEWFRLFLLGETKSPNATDELMKTIKHSDPNIRRQAVWVARKLSSEVAMPVISNAIKDPDSQVRETAIRVIGELNSEQAISLVAQILLKEPVSSVREIAVLCVLGNSESEAAIIELLRVAKDTNPHVSGTAVSCLKKMNHERLISVLTKSLKNTNNDVSLRKNAIELLGKLGDERIIPDLFEAQLDLNLDIHHQASYALFKVRNRATAKVM